MVKLNARWFYGCLFIFLKSPLFQICLYSLTDSINKQTVESNGLPLYLQCDERHYNIQVFFFFAFNSVRLKYGKTTHIKMMLRKNNNPPDNPNRAAFPYNPVSLGLNMQHQTSFKISKTFLRLLIYKKYKTLIHYEFTSLIIKPCIQSHANIKLTHYLLTVK